MQVWIYFQPGVGGDGIANLLEQSQTVVSIDSNPPVWRLHRYVDGELKFWAPTIDQLHCFRRDQPFKVSNNMLSQRYVELVKSNQNIVVTSHDIFLKNLRLSDEQHILEFNQVKVLITTQNPKQAMMSNLKKTFFNNLTYIQKTASTYASSAVSSSVYSCVTSRTSCSTNTYVCTSGVCAGIAYKCCTTSLCNTGTASSAYTHMRTGMTFNLMVNLTAALLSLVIVGVNNRY